MTKTAITIEWDESKANQAFVLRELAKQIGDSTNENLNYKILTIVDDHIEIIIIRQ